MRTHPWFQARAEYLSAHAPVMDRPSVLGDIELRDATERTPHCQVDHSMPQDPRYGATPPPECSVEVVAIVGCSGCGGSLLSCENGRAYMELCKQTAGRCASCLKETREVWWWRLI